MIPRVLIDQLVALRPDWGFHIFDSVGHLLPWEAPAAYVEVVGRWLSDAEGLRRRQPRPSR